MSNELKVIPRAVEYNVYYTINDEDELIVLLEIETNTRHQIGEGIEFNSGEDDEKLYSVYELSHDLYKHRLSESVVRWNFVHHYGLKAK